MDPRPREDDGQQCDSTFCDTLLRRNRSFYDVFKEKAGVRSFIVQITFLIIINDNCYAQFRVEEAVTDLNPHRSGRAQLRHPVPD